MSVFIVYDYENSLGASVYFLAAEAIAEKYNRVDRMHRHRCNSDHIIKLCPYHDRIRVVKGDFLDV